MPINIKWFPEQAFGEQAETRLTVPLPTQQNPITYLCSILKDPYGARSLFGPPSSGKSTIARQFLSVLRSDIVDAPEAAADLISDATATNTATMKTLADMREERKMRFPFFNIKRKVKG